MNTIDKLNNTLGYLTAMSFDRPELSNDLVEPLNTLSEAISEVENLSLSGVSQQRELLQKIESVKNFEWGINPVDNENRMCELIKLL